MALSQFNFVTDLGELQKVLPPDLRYNNTDLRVLRRNARRAARLSTQGFAIVPLPPPRVSLSHIALAEIGLSANATRTFFKNGYISAWCADDIPMHRPWLTEVNDSNGWFGLAVKPEPEVRKLGWVDTAKFRQEIKPQGKVIPSPLLVGWAMYVAYLLQGGMRLHENRFMYTNALVDLNFSITSIMFKNAPTGLDWFACSFEKQREMGLGDPRFQGPYIAKVIR